MRTVFLNPNSNAQLARRFEERIEAAGGVPGDWAVRCVPQAPHVITSPAEDRAAATATLNSVCAQGQAFDRVVLMSSVDTGYQEIRRLPGLHVFGFTRSVLGWHRAMGTRLQVVTFGIAMSAQYESIFRDEGNESVVQGHTVIEVSPAHLADGASSVSTEVASVCDLRHAASGTPVFLVGALALDLSDRLRGDSRCWIVDPIADLLAFLRHSIPSVAPEAT